MENFVSLILNESIDIYGLNVKYGSESLPHKMEYWDLELHICSDDNYLVLEKYVEEIREIFIKCNMLDLHCIITPFCMTNFCEFLSDRILDVSRDLKLKKVIISPKKDKKYKFIWEVQ
jgi:hypothetical protein